MSINISIEEYELFKNFKDQINEKKKKEFFDLNMKIMDREDKMYQRVHVYEKEKKIAYETLSILNREIDKARLVLESLREECADDKLKIIELEKKIECAVKLKNLKNFVNKNRTWISLENCLKAPECDYCHLIYQINYSYNSNKEATVKTFRSSILGPTFILLEDIYKEHKNRKKWISYENSFKRKFNFFAEKQKTIYRVSFLN